MNIVPFFRKHLTDLLYAYRMSNHTLAQTIGVPLSEVTEYMRGTKLPDLNIIQRISRFFDISPAFLFCDKSIRVLNPITSGLENAEDFDKLVIKLEDFYYHLSEILNFINFNFQFLLNFNYEHYNTLQEAGRSLLKEKIALVVTTFPVWFYGCLLNERQTKCIIVANRPETLHVIKYLNDNNLNQQRQPILLDEIYMNDPEIQRIQKFDCRIKHSTMKIITKTLFKMKSFFVEHNDFEFYVEKRLKSGFNV